jgi:predicted nucleic acid-binding protein
VIVVDVSAAVSGLLNDGDARRLLADESIAVPHLADSEIAHAVRAHALRRAISDRDGERALRQWARLSVRRFPAVGQLDRIWSLRHNLSAYDATYVALAEGLDCALLTTDARLGRARGPQCPITVVRS